ncbi:hypothetical protein KBA01_28070 [Kozakia baliensis]|nr:hypothetical protein KBA01_28070 [Kozakia baliensis]
MAQISETHHKAAGGPPKGGSETAEAIVEHLAARVEALATEFVSQQVDTVRPCLSP